LPSGKQWDTAHANSQDMQVGHLRQRYLWGPAVDQILAEEDVDGGTPELVKWTLTDHLNTVRDIARYDSQTDTTTVVNHLVYDAYGNVTSETNSAVESLFLFTARPLDADTGLQNNLNRWYDPSVGRWLSEDPITFAAGDANLYRYVANRVTALHDFSGMASREVTCTFDDGKTMWSVTIAASTGETAAQACQRYARGWGLGTPWKVLSAVEGALSHKEHGGTWESDYRDLGVKCSDCQRDAVAAELKCPQAILVRAGQLAGGTQVTGLGEEIIGSATGAGGAYMLIKLGTPWGWAFIGVGILIDLKGLYDLSTATKILEAANAAAARYCDCKNPVWPRGDAAWLRTLASAPLG